MANTVPDYDIEISSAISSRPAGFKGDANADMFAEDPNAQAVFGGFLQAAKESDRFTYIYWRKPLRDEAPEGDRGEIIPMPGWDSEYVQYSEMGFKPLLKYGRFRINNPSEPSGNWNILSEPYRRILLHPDGAKEFDVTQIAEQGWDVKSPYGVRFPQMSGKVINRPQCGICRKKFLNTEDLTRHETIQHRERSATENLARTLNDAAKQNQGPLAEVMLQFKDAVDNQSKMLAELQVRQQASDERFNLLLEKLFSDKSEPAPKSK